MPVGENQNLEFIKEIFSTKAQSDCCYTDLDSQVAIKKLVSYNMLHLECSNRWTSVSFQRSGVATPYEVIPNTSSWRVRFTMIDFATGDKYKHLCVGKSIFYSWITFSSPILAKNFHFCRGMRASWFDEDYWTRALHSNDVRRYYRRKTSINTENFCNILIEDCGLFMSDNLIATKHRACYRPRY